MPQIRAVAVIGVNIRLDYDRLVCPKHSSRWQSIGGNSRMRPLSNSAGCPDAMDPARGSVSSGAVVALCRTVAGRVLACKCRAERGFSCEAGWCRSQAIRCAQGKFRFRGPVLNGGFLEQSGAYRCFSVPWTPAIPHRAVTRSCARCSPLYCLLPANLRKRSCRHTAAYGSLSLSVCVATLPYSGSPHRHSQGLQCFLSRSPTLSGSFQKNLRLSLIL